MNTSVGLLKAFSRYSLGVAFSRISGMVRDIALAAIFGTSPQIALFMMAYRFSNLLRRLLAEGPLSSSFVPHYQTLHYQNPHQGLLFFKDALFLFTLFGIAASGACMAALEISRRALSYTPDSDEICRLTIVMFPSLVFLVIYGISSAFLQCHRRFFLPAIAPIAFNAIWILFALVCYLKKPKSPMVWMGWGVVIAFAFQSLIPLWASLKHLRNRSSFKEIFFSKIDKHRLTKLLKPFFCGTLGVATTQLNAALDSFFAFRSDPSGPAYLWYAIRIEQVPVALFAVALTAPLLSLISEKLQKNQPSELALLLKEACSKMIIFMSLSMWALLSLGPLGLNLVFGRGEFTFASLVGTYQCLAFYALGILPHGISLLYTNALYAKQEFVAGVKISFYTVALHILMNVLFVHVLDFSSFSVALSTSISSAFQMFLLKRAFFKSYGLKIFSLKKAALYLGFGVISALASWTSVIYFLKTLYFKNQLLDSSDALLASAVAGLVFLITYVLCEKMGREKDLYEMVKKITRG